MTNQIKISITLRLLKILFGIEHADTKHYIYYFESLRKSNGIIRCIEYMKVTRLHITRYICGQPLYVNNKRVSLTNGFPTHFLKFKKFIDNKDRVKIRGILTLLLISRAIIPSKKEEEVIKPLFNTITDKYKGKDYTIPLSFIEKFVKDNKLKLDKPIFDNTLHYFSSKGSPFGKATMSGPYALYWMMHFDHTMLETFLKFIGADSYRLMFENFMKELWNDHRLMYTTKFNGCLGKLSIIKDPELKRRVIAMLDYNSQVLLRPIHDGILGLLTKFPSDRTFTQNPKKEWKPKGNKFWSLDLSAATDRFPISLQQKLLGVIYSDTEFAKCWRDILIERRFNYKDMPSIEYSVGQPMGSYSSWAAFTISHHLVVAWSARICGLSNFNDYILLGDDIVINNDKVARKYISIMTRLGVDISTAKTHVSFNTYEFAKRWIQNRIEISPLPLKGILSNYKNLLVVLQQLVIYMMNNNTLYRGTALELISEVYNNLKIKKVQLNMKLINKKCYNFYHVLRYAFGLATPDDLRRYLVCKLPEYISVPNIELIPDFIRALLIQGLNDQAESCGDKVKVMFDSFISRYKNFEDFEITKLKDHPFLHALYNRLESMSKSLIKMNSNKEIDLIDAMVQMRIESVDKMVALKRDTSRTATGLDKLWKSSLNYNVIRRFELNPDYLIFNLKPFESYFLSNLSSSKDMLDNLRFGIYNDPTQKVDPYSMLFM